MVCRTLCRVAHRDRGCSRGGPSAGASVASRGSPRMGFHAVHLEALDVPGAVLPLPDLPTFPGLEAPLVLRRSYAGCGSRLRAV